MGGLPGGRPCCQPSAATAPLRLPSEGGAWPAALQDGPCTPGCPGSVRPPRLPWLSEGPGPAASAPSQWEEAVPSPPPACPDVRGGRVRGLSPVGPPSTSTSPGPAWPVAGHTVSTELWALVGPGLWAWPAGWERYRVLRLSSSGGPGKHGCPQAGLPSPKVTWALDRVAFSAERLPAGGTDLLSGGHAWARLVHAAERARLWVAAVWGPPARLLQL